jgi:hypothetical protein
VGTALVSLSVELIVATGSEFRQVRRAVTASTKTFGHAQESGKPEHKVQGYPLTLPGSKHRTRRRDAQFSVTGTDFIPRGESESERSNQNSVSEENLALPCHFNRLPIEVGLRSQELG